MQDIRFNNELGNRENKRLNAELKPGKGFCPACGHIVKKKVNSLSGLCGWCTGGKQDATPPQQRGDTSGSLPAAGIALDNKEGRGNDRD